MGGESLQFDKLTREMVTSLLKGMPDAPAQAAMLAKQAIVRTLGESQGASDQGEIVRQICFGMMGGLLLLDESLPKGAVSLLRSMAEAAQEVHVDPTRMLTWAVEGIARIARTAPPAVVGIMEEDIESCFEGAGKMFAEFRAKHEKT